MVWNSWKVDIQPSQHKSMINVQDDVRSNYPDMITIHYMYQNITVYPINRYNYMSIFKNLKRSKKKTHNQWKVINKSIFMDHLRVQMSTQRLWNNYDDYESSWEEKKIDKIICLMENFSWKNINSKKRYLEYESTIYEINPMNNWSPSLTPD